MVSSRDGISPVILPRDGSIYRRVVSVTLSKCVCVHAKLLQLCPTLCDAMDCSLPGLSVPGILQTRLLEWVAIHSSRGSSQPRDGTCVSYVSCFGRWVFTTSTTWESPLSKSLAKGWAYSPGWVSSPPSLWTGLSLLVLMASLVGGVSLLSNMHLPPPHRLHPCWGLSVSPVFHSILNLPSVLG